MSAKESLQFRRMVGRKGFQCSGKITPGNCALVLAVTNQLWGLGQNTSLDLHFLSWRIIDFPKRLF